MDLLETAMYRSWSLQWCSTGNEEGKQACDNECTFKRSIQVCELVSWASSSLTHARTRARAHTNIFVLAWPKSFAMVKLPRRQKIAIIGLMLCGSSLLLLLAFTTNLWVLASSFSRFRDHTQWHNTVGKTPLHEWSARRRELYLTTHTTLTTDKHPCPRRDSNSQSHQASGCRPTP